MGILGDRIRARLRKRFPKVQPPPPEMVVAESRVWVKVRAPRPWKPKQLGDVLVGQLLARTTKVVKDESSYGVVVLQTEQGPLTIAGVVISSLFDASGAPIGATVRVVYRGEHVSLAGRKYRDFDLYLAQDEQVIDE